MMTAAVVILIILTAVEVNMMMLLHLSLFHSENLKIFGRFAAELREVTYDLVECFDKRSIFGLDSTTNR